MTPNNNYSKLLVGILLTGSMAFTACMDSNYDVSDLDKNVAFGSDEGLKLPSKNSTKEIELSDLLDIDDSESVTTDENGDYLYKQSSSIDDVSDINVDKITLAKSGNPIENPVPLTGVVPFPSFAPEGYTEDYTGEDISDDIETFKYKTDPQENVVDLASAELSGEMTLVVYFSSKLREVVETIDEMSIELPPFMEFDVKNLSTNAKREGNIIKFTEQKTDNQAIISINVTKLDFSASKNTIDGNSVKFDKTQKTIALNGKVSIFAKIKKIKKRTIADDGYPTAAIRSTLTINDIIVNAATGKFDPNISINDNTIELNDLPDFMTDNNVVLDLYNPQIIFEANSKLPLTGKINATLEAKTNNGTVLKTIVIPEFPINENYNKICISRRNEDIPAGLSYDAIIVPDLSEIIENVPDKIELKIAAKADTDKDSRIELGHKYSLTNIKYNIQAPLVFDKKTIIVYNDTIDGWNEDLKDLKMVKGSYVELTADVTNRVPVDLTLSAIPMQIGSNGKLTKMDEALFKVEVSTPNNGKGNIIEAGSVDKPKTTKILIKVISQTEEALSLLDGISYHATAATPADGEYQGKALNKSTQKLKIENITPVLKGRIIVNLD